MTNYTNVFGNATVPPSEYGYAAIAMSSNTVTFWPYNYAGTGVILSKNNAVSATLASLTLALPDATQVSSGEDLIISNAGSNTFTVSDYSGNVLATIAPGVSKYFVLATNLVAAGSWTVTTFAAGSSSADASVLAGNTHRVNGTVLDNVSKVTPLGGTYTVLATDNGTTLVYSGGVGVVTLPSPSGLYNGFYVNITNEGTGTITLTPTSSLIDTAALKNIQPGESCTVVTDGSNYYTIGYGRSNTYVYTQLSLDLSNTATYTNPGTNTTITITSAQAVNKLWSFINTTVTANASITVTIPTVACVYYVKVGVIGGTANLTFTTGSGTSVNLVASQAYIIYCDGVNVTAAQTVSAISSIVLADGSVSTPSLSFANSASTGLYRIPGTGALSTTVGGVSGGYFLGTGWNGAIGATTPATGAFTTLSASLTVSGSGFSTYLASPPAIGGTTPAAGNFTAVTSTADSTFSSTGAIQISAGTTAQRPTAVTAKMRYNTDLGSAEIYNGSTWTSVGAGAVGGGTDHVFNETDAVASQSYTIGSGSFISGVTVTIATPGVFTLAAHGFVASSQITFSTTGALPTGLAINTVYYVIAAGLTSSNFEVALTDGGAAINTSGTQSGVHSVSKVKNANTNSPWVVATGVTITVPTGSNLVIV